MSDITSEHNFDPDQAFYTREQELLDRILRLEGELAEARQTIEDVALGTQVECVICGKYRPCNCDK